LEKADVVVIGSGAAGQFAAVRASQLGGKVIVVENGKIGGACVNWGCIPMLFLTRCAGLIKLLEEVENDGIKLGNVGIDFAKMMTSKDAAVNDVVNRVQDLFKANDIQVVKGWARPTSANQVEIELENGSSQVIKTKKIIVATGSVPMKLSLPGAGGEGVITVKEALERNQVPKSAVIIGGGVVGLELATVWANLGCVVSVVEVMPRIIPDEDDELALFIEDVLRRDGVKIYTGLQLARIDTSEGAKSITVSGRGLKRKVEAELVVFAVGQSPVVSGLGLEDIGIAVSDGRIQTNKRMETCIAGIYAAGDVTGEGMLASVAKAQGTVAAENAMGGDSTMEYRVVPRSVRTLPEIAAVGMTERESKERGLHVKIGKFPLAANSKAPILRERSGFVKIIADPTSGELLGVHIVGPQAAELIGEATMVMKMRGTVQDIASTIHPHPCVNEAIMAAARGLYNQSYYLANRKRLEH